MEPFTSSQWLFAACLATMMLAGAALAAIVLRAGPRRRTNQALALLLLAFVVNAPAIALHLFTDDLTLRYNALVYNAVGVTLILMMYLHFLPLAVDTPLTRPIGRVTTSRAFAAAGILAAILVVVFHGAIFRAAPEGVTRFGRTQTWEATELGVAISLVLNLVLLFSFIVALHAYVRAPAGSVAKSRAKNYAIAFGIWDAAQIVGNLSPVIRGVPDAFVETWLPGVYFPAFFLLFAILLVRALLKYQLFDFDLKLKWTLSRGTMAALFVAVFFVVAAVAEQYLQRFGVLAGGIAVGLLLFALRPIERLATRLVDGAMPRTRDTPVYVQFKKLEVYKAAVESALEGDGPISAREKEALERLRAKLGIVPEDARAIEAEVHQGIRDDALPSPGVP